MFKEAMKELQAKYTAWRTNQNKNNSAPFQAMQEAEKKMKVALADELNKEFKFVSIKIDKDYCDIRISNGTLEIPYQVNYKMINLPNFKRKPGKKQIAAREAEVLAKCPPHFLTGLTSTEDKKSQYHLYPDMASILIGYGSYVIFVRAVKVLAA